MNVFDNIAFGLKIKKTPKTEIETKVKEALRLVQLAGYEKRGISEMSGGKDNELQLPGRSSMSLRSYC